MSNDTLVEQVKDLEFPDSSWSRYGIDKEAYQVFIVLQHNPTLPVSRIAEELGVSTTLVNSRLNHLKEVGFLRPDSEIMVPFLGRRQQTAAEAVYSPHKLGLQRVHFLLTSIPGIAELRRLEILLETHPSTHYTVASFGNGAAIYAQFDVDPSAIDHLNVLMRTLQDQGLFSEYSMLQQDYLVSSEFDYTKWHLNSDTWELYASSDLSPVDFRSEIDLLWRDFLAVFKPGKISSRVPIVAIKLDQTDLRLLRELTVNANPNITKLSGHYSLSRSRVSRKIKRLRNQVIDTERLVYDHRIFDISHGQLITGSFRHGSDLNVMTFHAFVRDFIPFTTNLVLSKNRFMWYILAPPSYVSEMTRLVWQLASNIQIFPLDLTTSRTYYFDPAMMDDDGSWRNSKKFIVDIPLEILRTEKD